MFFLPTRGRPQNLKRFLEAWYRTNAHSPVAMYLDDDDPCLTEYRQIKQRLDFPANWTMHVGARIRIGPVMNFLFQQYPKAKFYGLIGDDALPETEYWDQILIHTAGNKAVAYPDDGMWHEEIATHPVIGGDLVRAVGFLCYDGLKEYFIDTFWDFVAKKLEIARYCPHVIVDHRHHSNDKAPVDQTYREKWQFAESDRKIYDDFVSSPDTAQFLAVIRDRLNAD